MGKENLKDAIREPNSPGRQRKEVKCETGKKSALPPHSGIAHRSSLKQSIYTDKKVEGRSKRGAGEGELDKRCKETALNRKVTIEGRIKQVEGPE